MRKDQIWTIAVHGPHGEKIVCLDNDQVELFAGIPDQDPYAAACWLAYCDLWTREDAGE